MTDRRSFLKLCGVAAATPVLTLIPKPDEPAPVVRGMNGRSISGVIQSSMISITHEGKEYWVLAAPAND